MEKLQHGLGRLVPRGIRGALLLLLLVALVPILLVQAGIYYSRFEERRTQELQANLELARSVAVTFDNFIQDILREELAIGIALISPQPLEDEHTKKLLVESANFYASVLHFSWIDPEGWVITSSEPAMVGISIGDRDYFREIASGRQWVVSDLLHGKVSGKLGFTVARGMRDKRGDLLGIIVASVDPHSLAETLTLQRGGQGAIAILDTSARIVYRYPAVELTRDQREWSEKQPDIHELFLQRVDAGREVAGTMVSPVDKKERLIGVAPIQSFGWMAVASRPAGEAMAPVVSDLLRTSALLFAVTAVVFAAALVLGRELTAPLVRLREHAAAIGRGELDRRIKPNGLAELRELAVAFNRMAEQLRIHVNERDRSIASLKQSEEERERMVAQIRDVNSRLVVSNIEAQAQAETAQRTAAELDGIFSAITDPIVIYDSAGVPVRANQAAIITYGFDPTDTNMETRIQRLVIRHSDGRPCEVSGRPSMRALRGETLTGDRFILTNAQGRKFMILVSAAPLVTNGKITGAVSVWHDVTERERLLEHLRFLAGTGSILTSSLDLDAIVQGVARLAVPTLADWCVVDVLEGDTPMRQVAVASADPSNEGVAREIQRLYPPQPGASGHFSEVMRTGAPILVAEVTDSHLTSVATDAEHLRMIRELGPTSYMMVPLVVRERTLGVISLAYTSSRRRYNSEDLLLAEEFARRASLAIDNARLYRQAQDAIGLRDEFLTVAAHELKTPLTALLGYTQLTLRQFAREGTPDLQRLSGHLQVMEQQSKKLAALITQLLDISRLEARRLALERNVADIANLARDVTERSKSMTGRHDFVVRAPDTAPAMVDALRIEQVLLNLVENAIKYSPNGGTIEVEVSAPDPERIEIVVRDHGIGVPLEHRQRIFDRFYQAHGHVEFGGMGLGLYISRQIVELHGGELEAEFPPDGGSRFIFRLPAKMEKQSPPMI